MKDSKEKEHRISNLKNMMNHVNDDVKDDEELDYDLDDEEYEEDEELINYLHENDEDEEFEIDDEYIYRPGKEDDATVINLEDENKIDENFIIETNINEELDDSAPSVGSPMGFEEEISENFDNLVNIQIGEKPILAIVSLILGILFVIFAIIVFNSGTDRIIDNVVSGETISMMVVLLIIGLLLLFYGVFKIFNFTNPFDNLMNNIDDDGDKNKDEKPKLEKKSPVMPKSNIPLDKEAYKIGEFDMEELKNSLKKSFSKNTGSSKKDEDVKDDVDVEDLPPAREKSDEMKGRTKEEIEEIEYEKAQLDGETIDEIFSKVEDLPNDKK